jgi:mannose-6-phosphate isomerase-like protein (cupin superfamily)
MSLTWVSINGRHRELASRRSVRAYYVLSGELTFFLSGAAPETLRPGEALVVPRGRRYYLEGTGTYLVINTPAFREGDDEY